MHKIDIILPLYKPHPGWNENMLEQMKALSAFFKEKAEVRFVLADDGSGKDAFDSTALDTLKNAVDHFSFVSYPENHGKGYCIRYAARQSHADFVLYTDGDFPFGWHGIAGAWKKLEEGADVVMGVRDSGYSAALSPGRKLISSGVRFLNRLLLGLPDKYLDAQAGLKGFNHRGLQAFLAAKTETFLFDTEFILIAWTHGLKIETTPLSLRPGLRFSRMGFAVMRRELLHFIRILWTFRILHKKVFSPER